MNQNYQRHGGQKHVQIGNMHSSKQTQFCVNFSIQIKKKLNMVRNTFTLTSIVQSEDPYNKCIKKVLDEIAIIINV